MSVSTQTSYSSYSNPIHFGFLGICEGTALGLITGWLLQNHGQQPVIFVGCGIFIAALYYYLLSLGRGTLLGLAIVVLSMVIWGFVGWQAGGFAFHMFGTARTGLSMLDTLLAWKVLAALVLAFLAYSEKASNAGWSEFVGRLTPTSSHVGTSDRIPTACLPSMIAAISAGPALIARRL